MADINFDCPHCGQNIDAPEQIAGRMAPCPNCKAVVQIPGEPAAGIADADDHKPAPPSGYKKVPKDQLPALGEEKGTTTRIELPPEFIMPPRKQRVIFIKRGDKP